MNKFITLCLHPAYRIFRVFKDNDVSAEENWPGVTDRTLAQGFAARPDGLSFYTLGDCMSVTIEVWLAWLTDKT